MYKFNDLEKVAIGERVAMNLISTPITRNEEIKAFFKSVNLVEAGVKFVMRNDLYLPMDIDVIGENLDSDDPKELRAILEHALAEKTKIKFGRFYSRNAPKTANQFFYQILVQCIHEYGRCSNDPIESVVLTMMDSIFDKDAIEGDEDMLIWSLILEFLNDALNGRSYPFGRFIKERGSSSAKVQKFIEKNNWYQDPENFGKIFGIDREKPKIQEIMKSAVRVMSREHQKLIEMIPE